MEVSQGKGLIAQSKVLKNEIWADLGCGSGFFTHVLNLVFNDLKMIFAVDSKENPIATNYISEKIHFIQSDFEKESLNIPSLDGILMANSLHFVKNKGSFLENIKKQFRDGKGKWIVIEYEQTKPNHWIPFPISYSDLKILFAEAGYKNFKYLGDYNSLYGRKMYSAFIH